jgi:hypothetical protein
MKFEISQKDYDNYHAKKEKVVNERVGHESQDVFDMLLSEDMTKIPECQKILEQIEALD